MGLTIKFRFAAVVVATSVAATTGCTPGSPEGATDDTLTVDLHYLLDELDALDANTRQRDAVVAAFEAGHMDYDVVDELFRDYIVCLENAGFTVDGVGRQELYAGVYAPTARIQFPPSLDDEAAFQVDLGCARTHYSVAEQYYLGQPVSRESYLDSFEVQREWILECLEDRGMDPDPDATRLELLYAVTEAGYRDPLSPPCYQGSVFDGYLPPGVDPMDLYPPEILDLVDNLEDS